MPISTGSAESSANEDGPTFGHYVHDEQPELKKC